MLRGHRCDICPRCGQTIRGGYRLGIYLGEVPARVFDAIKRGGPDGIDGDALFDLIFAARGVGRGTLKTHVWAINDLIAVTGWRIVCQRGAPAYYFLRRTRRMEAAE